MITRRGFLAALVGVAAAAVLPAAQAVPACERCGRIHGPIGHDDIFERYIRPAAESMGNDIDAKLVAMYLKA